MRNTCAKPVRYFFIVFEIGRAVREVAADEIDK